MNCISKDNNKEMSIKQFYVAPVCEISRLVPLSILQESSISNIDFLDFEDQGEWKETPIE